MSSSLIRPRVELELIRDFQLRCGGEPVTLTHASERLVAYVALQHRPVPRTRASEVLWCDADQHHAGASLRSALWRLPADNIVASSGTHVWLDPGVVVDLNRVMERALTVLGSARTDETAPALAAELIGVGDDLLPGWPDEWVVLERERFRQVRLQAMDRIGEDLLDAGRCCDALQVALAATTSEPLRESAHRVLVRVHLRQGNVAEAIREYRHYADLLKAELDARPSQIMRDLLAPFVSHALA